MLMKPLAAATMIHRTMMGRLLYYLAFLFGLGVWSAAPAQTTISYTLLDNPVPLSNPGFTEYYFLDFNGDGTTNLTFAYDFTTIGVRPEGKNRVAIRGGSVTPLSSGVQIGPGIEPNALRWYAGATPTSFVGIINCWGNCGGAFRGKSGYMGVEFEIDDNIHYGWVSMRIGDILPIGSIYGWAWNTVPGESIRAGEIPEPATVALLAGIAVLGVAVFVRRRRNG